MCQVRNIPFEDQRNSFLLSLGPGVYIFEESPKSIQDVIGDVYCPGKYCSNREKCKSIGGYVTTPRSIHGCDNFGAWLFVQKVPFRLKEHVLSSVEAQDMNTSSYQVSDLEDIEFNCENSQLEMDAVFRPGIDTPFSPTNFDDLLMGDRSVENPIVLDEEEDKENAPSTPESARPTEPPRLQRSRAFGNVPD